MRAHILDFPHLQVLVDQDDDPNLFVAYGTNLAHLKKTLVLAHILFLMIAAMIVCSCRGEFGYP